jgi:hypothetical protein
MNLERLVDAPDQLTLALRQLLGLESAKIFSSIRSELLLSSVGSYPRNGRLEAFLSVLQGAKESVEAGIK